MTVAAGAAKAGPDGVSVAIADDDERLRGLIRAELDRQHAMPMARRTLELLAEAAAEPADDELGYRIVDRNGQTRLQRDLDPDENRGDVTAPMTLRDLVAELRERYPDLFRKPPEPEPEPVPPPPPEPEHDRLAEVRAAGSRFVETQSALAKSLAASVATSSAEHGRAFASAASERFEGLRGRIGARLKTAETPGPAGTGLSAATPDAETSRAVRAAAAAEPASGQAAGRTGGSSWATLRESGYASGRDAGEPARDGRRERERRFADLGRHGRDALARFYPDSFDPSWLRRATYAGLGAACLAAIVAAAVIVSRNDDASPPAGMEASRTDGAGAGGASKVETRNEAKVEPRIVEPKIVDPKTVPVPAPEEAKPGAGEGAPEDAEARPAEETPPAPDPTAIVGVPQVIDTATLKIAGKVVPLFGVAWVRGGQAEELTKYLHGRSVTCRPAPGSSAYLCRVDGRDLSEVVLFNGGGRASPEASPDLVAAEDHARSERLGVWKR